MPKLQLSTKKDHSMTTALGTWQKKRSISGNPAAYTPEVAKR
jgi:hypothetical protein